MGGARVPVLVGPTAVGKTAVALALRRYWPLEVISADSRQVYRRLDIGTAKPTPEGARPGPASRGGPGRSRHPLQRGPFRPRRRRVDRRDAEPRRSCRSSWVAPGSTSGRWPRDSFTSRRSIRPGGARWTRSPRGWSRSSCFAGPGGSIPGFRGWWPAAGRAGDRGGAAHRLPAHPLAGGRARERRDPALVRRAHRAATGAAPADRAAGGGDGAPRADRGGGVGAGGGPRTDRAGARRDRHSGGGRVPSWPAAARDASPTAIAVSTRQYAKRQETWFRHQLGGDGGDAGRHPAAGEAGGGDCEAMGGDGIVAVS